MTSFCVYLFVIVKYIQKNLEVSEIMLIFASVLLFVKDVVAQNILVN